MTITLSENAVLKAGDIVGGDKVITTTTTTHAVDVETLCSHLAELAALARGLRRAVDAEPGIDESRRDGLVHALSSAGRELGAAGQELRELSPGQVVPAALSTRIKEKLADLDATSKSASSLVTHIAGLVHKLAPLINAVGRLLG